MKNLFRKTVPFTKKVSTIQDFYNKNYTVNFSKNELEISGLNALVFIFLQEETFTKKNYPMLEKQVTSSIRICGLYSKVDKNKPRSPKKYSRKMLCYGLHLLLLHGRISLSDTISLEADPSENNNLVEKVYVPMGFQLVAQTSPEVKTGGLMISDVETILSWCNETDF